MLLGVSSALSLYRGSFSCHFTAWNVASKILTGNFFIYSHLLDQRFFSKKTKNTHAFWGTLEHPPKRPTATKKSAFFFCVVKVEPTSTWNPSIFFCTPQNFFRRVASPFCEAGALDFLDQVFISEFGKRRDLYPEKNQDNFCVILKKSFRGCFFWNRHAPSGILVVSTHKSIFVQQIACFRTWRRWGWTLRH